MDWFERLTGFRETGYDDTRAKLKVEASRLPASPTMHRASRSRSSGTLKSAQRSALVHIKINSANDGTKTAIAFCVQPITEPSSS